MEHARSPSHARSPQQRERPPPSPPRVEQPALPVQAVDATQRTRADGTQHHREEPTVRGGHCLGKAAWHRHSCGAASGLPPCITLSADPPSVHWADDAHAQYSLMIGCTYVVAALGMCRSCDSRRASLCILNASAGVSAYICSHRRLRCRLHRRSSLRLPSLAHSAAAARACSCAAFASAISAASGSLRDACFSACASASFIDRAVLSLLHHTHTRTISTPFVCML
jgi:hypothetical protein